MLNVACYIDGFNLYHAIDELAKPELKWIDLHKLAVSFLRKDECIATVHFFTALSTWDAGKRRRHVNYLRALETVGTVIHYGKFEKTRRHCHTHDRSCPFREEKRTDVAIAVTVLSDAYENRFDRAILMTADADQIPTVRQVKAAFPAKQITLVAPPNRLRRARDLGNVVDKRLVIHEGRLRACMFPRNVLDADGKTVASMPAVYRQNG